MPDNNPTTPQPASTLPKPGSGLPQPKPPAVAGGSQQSLGAFPLPPGIRMSPAGAPVAATSSTSPSAAPVTPAPKSVPVASAAPSAPVVGLTKPVAVGLPPAVPSSSAGASVASQLNKPLSAVPTAPALSAAQTPTGASKSEMVGGMTAQQTTTVFSAQTTGGKPPLSAPGATPASLGVVKPQLAAKPSVIPTTPISANLSAGPVKIGSPSGGGVAGAPGSMQAPVSAAIPPARTVVAPTVVAPSVAPFPGGKSPTLPPAPLLSTQPPLPQGGAVVPKPAQMAAPKPITALARPVVPTPAIAQVKPLVQAEAPVVAASKTPAKAPTAVSMMAPAALPKKSLSGKMLAIIGGVFALILIVVFALRAAGNREPTSGPAISKNGGGAPAAAPVQNIKLTYWGLWEKDTVMSEVFAEFQKQNPGVTIEYVYQSPKDYRERLQDALQKGAGPDLFRYHATWIPMMKKELAALPTNIMSEDEYKTTFFPVFSDALRSSGKIVGIPHMYEGLGLFYNIDVLEKAGITPPKEWVKLDDDARTLTILDGEKIQQAGIALGTASNVDNFSDIILLLILQNGGDPASLTSKKVREAFLYYTNFAKNVNSKTKVWDSTLPASTYAFATEKTAMMLAPSWRAHEVKAINPNLKFAIAPVPQLLKEKPVTFASFWAEGVSSSSKNQEMAWKLLKFLSSKEMLQKFYQDASSKTPRTFGEIYPRQDMAALIASDPLVGAFVSDALKAKTWYSMASRTFDSGINDKIIKYIEDAVNAVGEGGDLDEALKTAQEGVNQVLQSYGIPIVPTTSGAAAAP